MCVLHNRAYRNRGDFCRTRRIIILLTLSAMMYLSDWVAVDILLEYTCKILSFFLNSLCCEYIEQHTGEDVGNVTCIHKYFYI